MSQNRRWLRVLALLLPIATLIVWYEQESNPNVRFRRLKKEFDEAYQATYSPQFDSLQWGIIEPKNLQKRTQLFTYYYPKFKSFANHKLHPNYQKQWQQTHDLIKNQLTYLPNLTKDPTLYNFGILLKRTLQLKDSPLNNRLQQIENQLQHAPNYYTTAKDNLITPDSTKLKPAIQQQLQTLKLLRSELLDSLAHSSLPEFQKQNIIRQNAQVQLIVKDYLAFCRSLLFEYQDSAILK